jgi:hypothetical protein
MNYENVDIGSIIISCIVGGFTLIPGIPWTFFGGFVFTILCFIILLQGEIIKQNKDILTREANILKELKEIMRGKKE